MFHELECLIRWIISYVFAKGNLYLHVIWQRSIYPKSNSFIFFSLKWLEWSHTICRRSMMENSDFCLFCVVYAAPSIIKVFGVYFIRLLHLLFISFVPFGHSLHCVQLWDKWQTISSFRLGHTTGFIAINFCETTQNEIIQCRIKIVWFSIC